MAGVSTCKWIMDDETECGELCEGRTDFCGSHNRQMRREATEQKKQSEKRRALLQKVKAKNQKPRQVPSKVSAKREVINEEYSILEKQFKNDNPNCNAKINEYCTKLTDDIHHTRGRGIYLLDVSTWISVCRNCHQFIHDHPADAMKRGLSFSRLSGPYRFEEETTEELKATIDKFIEPHKI